MTQPVATVIAGLLAVAAAVIAFGGVWLNIRHQRSVENRSRAIDQITQAVAAVETLAMVLVWLPGTDADGKARGQLKVLDALERAQIATARLEVFGLNSAARATREYVDATIRASQTDLGPPNENDRARVNGRALAVKRLREARQEIELSTTRAVFDGIRSRIKQWWTRADD
ncbi:hypothetical protein AB0F85_07275 [Nocardia fluminea]|uniref:hypothetical protein n=1 Tax=Nocardia fluminea TaxID=134984 RepID=UPI0033FB6349